MSKLPNPGDEVAFITLRMYADRSLAIEGNVADAKLAQQMLGAASEAVGHKLAREENKPLIIPQGYFDSKSDSRYPLVPLGDRK